MNACQIFDFKLRICLWLMNNPKSGKKTKENEYHCEKGIITIPNKRNC